MKFLLFFNKLFSVETTTAWLTEKGLLLESLICTNCNLTMIKELCRRNKNVPLVWRCQKCKKTKSILTRSLFENIKIDIRNYILLNLGI